MTDAQWRSFTQFKADFAKKTADWRYRIESAGLTEALRALQKRAAERDGVPPYSLDTQIVYNRSIDDIKKEDDIKIILIGDNPGKDEQLERNRRYLVGQSGKIADGFFRKNPELGIDFRKNVLILNKTPLHTAKTKELALIIKEGPPLVADIIRESQIWFAAATAKLHRALCSSSAGQDGCTNVANFAEARNQCPCELWLVGYAELRPKGLFVPYRDALNAAYADCLQEVSGAASRVFVYQHFSMNRFLIDLKEKSQPELTLKENLHRTGLFHRKEILGW